MMIGELSKKSETGIETIRYYEREGLIAPASRKPSGYRNYDPSDALSRLRFIKRAKELGFSLKEIRELLSLEYPAFQPALNRAHLRNNFLLCCNSAVH